MNPEKEWLDLSKQTRMEMIAKRQLEIDRENRISKEMKKS